MNDVETITRCKVYNATHGTNLTPEQYYLLELKDLRKNEATAPRDSSGMTDSLRKNINKAIRNKI